MVKILKTKIFKKIAEHRRAEANAATAEQARKDAETKMKDLLERLTIAEAEAMKMGGRKQLTALQQKVI